MKQNGKCHVALWVWLYRRTQRSQCCRQYEMGEVQQEVSRCIVGVVVQVNSVEPV